MINPNATHKVKGFVKSVVRREDGSLRDIEFELYTGQTLQGVLNLDHKTIKEGERVVMTVGFRITSDRYVVESFRRSK